MNARFFFILLSLIWLGGPGCQATPPSVCPNLSCGDISYDEPGPDNPYQELPPANDPDHPDEDEPDEEEFDADEADLPVSLKPSLKPQASFSEDGAFLSVRIVVNLLFSFEKT